MKTNIAASLGKYDRTAITTVGLALIILLGAIDFLLGYEISFSIFYLAPISLVTWSGGRRQGFAVSVISVLVWLGADIARGYVFTHPLIPVWNALIRLGFFLIVVTILSRLKLSYEEQKRIAHELRESIDKIKTLSGLIPICAWCKKVRDDKGYWQQVEAFISENSEASFTHSICQECQEGQERELQAMLQSKR